MADAFVDRQEYRAVIRFCVRRKLKGAEIHRQLQEAYGPAAPSYATVRKWCERFRGQRESLADDKHTGRPKHEDWKQMVEEFLLDQPFASVRCLSLELGLARETVRLILTRDLGMKKYCSRWIPHVLSAENKASRVRLSANLLSELESGDISNVITCDESWFYHEYSPEGRWAKTAEEVAPRAKLSIGSKKTMLTVFWGIKGFYLIDFMESGKRFDSSYACLLLSRLDESLKKNPSSHGLRGMRIHWDNARPHVSASTRDMVKSLGAQILPHPPYSPDLAPSDFFLFGHVKRLLRGSVFGDESSLVAKVAELARGFSEILLCSVFDDWKSRLRNVSMSDGSYIF